MTDHAPHRRWERIAHMALPTGMVTGLLYYLGWVHTRAIYRELGVRPSQLGFGTVDYVLRSLNVLVKATSRLIIIALVVLLGMAAIRWLRQRFDPAGRYLLGGVLALAGLLATFFGPGTRFASDPVDEAAVRLAGALVLGAAGYLALEDHPLVGATGGDRPRTPLERDLSRIIVLATVVVGLFGISAAFDLTRAWADRQGVERVLLEEREPHRSPEASLVSSVPLGLERFGVEVTTFGAGEHTRYRYTGLRVFGRAGSQLLVWPCNRFLRDGIVVVDVDLVEQYEQRAWRPGRNEVDADIPAQDSDCPRGDELLIRHWLADLATSHALDGVEVGWHQPVPGDGMASHHSDLWLARGDELLLVVEIAETTFFVERDELLPAYAEAGAREVWFVNGGTGRVEIYRDPSPGDGIAELEFTRTPLVLDRSGETLVLPVPGLACGIEPSGIDERRYPVGEECFDV